MLKAIEVQKKSDQWQRDNGQYIPYPATWLNGRRWEDEIQPIGNGKDGEITGGNGDSDTREKYARFESYSF